MFSLRRYFTPSCSKVVATQQQQLLARSAVLTCSAMNVQSMCMQSSSASAASSSSNNNNNNRRNFNNNNNNRNNNNNMQRRNNHNNNNYAANRTLGAVEFFDVRDSAKDGREMRLAFRHDSSKEQRIASITIRPQLGPRKTDPHDPTPQFDQANRLTLRLKPKEVATILHWMSGRVGGDAAKSVEVAGASYKISLAQQDSGVLLVTLTGTKLDGTPSEPLGYELQPHQQIQFRVFLENALEGFFGIATF